MRYARLITLGLCAAGLQLAACDKEKAASKSDKAPASATDSKKAGESPKKPTTAPNKADGTKPMDHAKMGHSKGDKAGAVKKAGTPGADAKAAAGPAGSVTAGDHGKALVAAYEKVRLALARDDWEGTKSAATAFGTWAKTHAAKVDPKLKAHVDAIAAAAEKLVGAADIEASRGEAFGSMSKHTLSVVVMAKDLGEGITAYRCPMAKAYKKWIQLDAEMANPYMGKRMLKCGAKVPLEV